jgi:hypothetical protein
MSEKPTYSRRGWLKLIKVDPDLRPSVFKTAYEICEYVNSETGEFFAAPKTIAEGGDWGDGIAMSEATVIEDIKRLEAAGYLKCIERGRRGRGHSSRFRIVSKPQSAEISRMSQWPRDKTAKTSVSRPENLRIASIKPQPADMNLREPVEPKSKSAPPARSSARVDRVDVTETEEGVDEYGNDPIPF